MGAVKNSSKGGWALVVLVAAACRSLPAAVVGAQPATPPQAREVQVESSDYGQAIRAVVGDTLSVAVPLADREWVVDFDASVLEPLSGQDLRAPADGRWRFRCRAAGESDLAVTARTPGHCGETPVRRVNCASP